LISKQYSRWQLAFLLPCRDLGLRIFHLKQHVNFDLAESLSECHARTQVAPAAMQHNNIRIKILWSSGISALPRVEIVSMPALPIV
jgi:hypothetical protein